MSWNLSKSIAAVWCLTLISGSFANAHISDKQSYYGSEFLGQVQSGQLKDGELLEAIFRIASDAHIKTKGAPDTFAANCNSVKLANNQSCIQHTSLGYDRARLHMFGKIHLEEQNGKYVVKDVYCEKYFSDEDFGQAGNIAPGTIPSNGSILNTEHTWPQSKFTTRFPTAMQKSDIHHLFPTDSSLNSHRSSLQFGEVGKEMEKLKCPQNRLGQEVSGKGGTVFEPPVAHRGNVARAIFYFATRYKMKVSGAQEATLKKWNREDPVDAQEIERNNMVEDVQGNRNPYVDYPELIDQVKAFTFNTVK
jgi:hypothetical protein